MEILWHGLSFFEIKSKKEGEKVVIAVNPFDENTTLKLPKIKADIIILSSSLFSNTKIIEKAVLGRKSNLDKTVSSPFLIEGPGEYETKGVKIKGMPDLQIESEAKTTKNTIFKIESEGIKICHLGNFNKDQVPSEILESILGIDILLVPIGGYFTILGKEAAKIVSQIEPKIVIPMNYLPSEVKGSFKIKGQKVDLEDEKNFLKSFGVNKTKEKIKKLKIKASDFQKDGTELILLEIT